MENSKLIKHLEKIGFGDKSALVYATLLERGGAYPSAIAEATKLNRSTVYKLLLDLSVKGLVTEVERAKKLYYQVERPEKLLHFTKNKIKLAEEQFDNAERLMPRLTDIFSSYDERPKIRFFEGRNAISNICTDMISEPNRYEMLSFSNAKLFRNYLPESELREFVRGKERLGITTRGILPDTVEDREYANNVFSGVKRNIWPKMRFVPSEQFPFEAELTTYGENKVAITKLTETNVIGIIIEDKTIHGMIKMIFEIAWLQAKE
jgi:sugar-specific transcriptional regulator TrmB